MDRNKMARDNFNKMTRALKIYDALEQLEEGETLKIFHEDTGELRKFERIV